MKKIKGNAMEKNKANLLISNFRSDHAFSGRLLKKFF